MNQVLPIRRLRAAPMKAFETEAAAFRAGRWLQGISGNEIAAKWCRDNGVVSRAQSEGLNSAGGVFVPHEVYTAILRLREQYGVFRRNATVVPMSSELTSVPRASSPLIAYFTAEGIAITPSTATMDNINLVAGKAAALAIGSSEFDEDSAIDLADWVADESAYALAVLEDTSAFNGDGSPTYNGVQGIRQKFAAGLTGGATPLAGSVDAASGHDTFAEIDSSDINSLIAKLPGYALPNARWYVSPVGFALTFCRLASGYGGFVSRRINGRNELTFAGFPVETTVAMPTSTGDLSDLAMIVFGDMNLAGVLGDRREMTITRSTEHKFAEDQVAWKATERVDINVHGLGDATTAGPIVALMGE